MTKKERLDYLEQEIDGLDARIELHAKAIYIDVFHVNDVVQAICEHLNLQIHAQPNLVVVKKKGENNGS